MVKFKIKKGDMVEVIAGDDKGRKAKVISVMPKKESVLVEGCRVAKRTVKPSEKNPNGGFISKEMPIHISNVRLAEGA